LKKYTLRVTYILIPNKSQLLLLTYDILFQYHLSYKSCENRPVWGASQFPALWHLAEGLFYFLKYFYKKEGFLIKM